MSSDFLIKPELEKHAIIFSALTQWYWMAYIEQILNILCVSDFCLFIQPGLVLNLVCGVLVYSSVTFPFSLIKLQAGIDVQQH